MRVPAARTLALVTTLGLVLGTTAAAATLRGLADPLPDGPQVRLCAAHRARPSLVPGPPVARPKPPPPATGTTRVPSRS
ncbi:hypothetical protein [Actinokineospora enzanensis]|uniref:hypothetical protein n=1 Tax=Actinokineospora enzanensis TaxID=155975 RepID=UPI000361160F|nr:hypothetical protein [Actinokineospora enzanensis]